MRVTQAYRNRMLEEEFENDPLTTEHSEEDQIIKKLNGLSHQAHLKEQMIHEMDKKRFLKLINVSGNNNLAQSVKCVYNIFEDSIAAPVQIGIFKSPLNKHPEIENRVLKAVVELEEIYSHQIELIDRMRDEFRMTPQEIYKEKWSFRRLAPLQQ